ncbi:uncharacterized protein LOC122508377 [Leptopilina heterotoma]|uniref:uncharacterized protein LOC122508377 n=1 Tax=Leptopilina heterotoma TaxID=63436 RepID=UPI001CA80F43|nr:uncharacterized protein LOC122508377 [Leptopilina heterotoma]
MDSLLLIFFGIVSAIFIDCTTAGVIPSAVALPSPIGIEYAKAVPYNAPPHVSRIDLNSKILSAPWFTATAGSLFNAPPFAVTAPVSASQIIAAPVHPAPVTAAYPALATPPIVSGPLLDSPSYLPTFTYPTTFPAYDHTIFG